MEFKEKNVSLQSLVGLMQLKTNTNGMIQQMKDQCTLQDKSEG